MFTKKDSILLYVLLSIFIFFFVPHTLFSFGMEEVEVEIDTGADGAEIKEITDMQDSYTALPASVSLICMLPVGRASGVPDVFLKKIEYSLPRYMVTMGIAKPVTMDKWFTQNYLKKKVSTPFALIRSITAERYTIPLSGICKPYIFASGSFFVLQLSFYPFVGSLYPTIITRVFKTIEELDNVLVSSLSEFSKRSFTEGYDTKRKKVIVAPFIIENRKLVEVGSGEFEFVTSPFIEKEKVTIKKTDDYFSRLFAYLLRTTNLFTVMPLQDLSDYCNTDIYRSYEADYIIKGRIQITDQFCVLYIDLYNASSGKIIYSVKNPITVFSLEKLWTVFQHVNVFIAEKIFSENSISVIKDLQATGYGLYSDNMFIGWNSIKELVRPKGLHIVETLRISFQKKKDKKTPKFFYILLDSDTWVFTDRNGAYIENLLSNKGE